MKKYFLILATLFSLVALSQSLKISELTSLTNASLATNDVFPIVDTSATTTKKFAVSEFDLRYAFTVSAPLSKTAGASPVVSIPAATNSVDGYLSLTDWSTFNNKVSLTGAETLTNKTINGANNTITNVSLTSGITGTLPVANGGTGLTSTGTSGNVLTSNGTAWVSSSPASAPVTFYEISNIGLATSVGSSALTLALKQSDGATNCSTGAAACKIGFRSSTATSGAFNQRSAEAALSLVISSGSTLGQTSGQPSYIWVYAIDNAGTIELAVSHSKFNENTLVSTTAEGGAGAADSATVLYSTAARSNVPCRLLGYVLNTQTTAGTWASAGTQIQLAPYILNPAPTIQTFTSGSGTYNTPAGVTKIRVLLVGGGGGAGAPDSGTSAGGTGGSTTFGSSLLTAPGGSGSPGGPGGVGGAGAAAATVNSPAIGTGWAGTAGGNGAYTADSNGGDGGNSILFPGRGNGGYRGFAGGDAVANTGGGGGGGGGFSGLASSGGGGGGASADAIIINPLSSYSYAVGAAGTKGSTGASGIASGNSAAGYILVYEYYD